MGWDKEKLSRRGGGQAVNKGEGSKSPLLHFLAHYLSECLTAQVELMLWALVKLRAPPPKGNINSYTLQNLNPPPKGNLNNYTLENLNPPPKGPAVLAHGSPLVHRGLYRQIFPKSNQQRNIV